MTIQYLAPLDQPELRAVIEGLDPRFKQLGLVQLKECDREEEVPFVLCEKSGDGIDEEEPILAPATVDQCLFEEL